MLLIGTGTLPVFARSGADAVLEQAQKYLELAVYDSCAYYLHQATESKDQTSEFRCRTDILYARLMIARDDYGNAEKILKKVCENAADPSFQTEANLLLGFCYARTGRYDESENLLALTEKDIAGSGEESSRYLGELNFYHGYLEQIQQNYHDALEYYEKSLDGLKKSVGENHPDFARTLNYSGQCYRALGETDLALEYHQKALAILRVQLPDDHPDLGRTYLYLGICAYFESDYYAAEEYYGQTLRIRRKKLGERHRTVASVYNNLGLVNWKTENYSQAISQFEKAVDIYREILGEQSMDVANIYNNMGLCYNGLASYDSALNLFEKSLTIKQRLRGPAHISLASIYNNMGTAQKGKKEYWKAIQLFQKTLEISEKNLGTHHQRVAKHYNNIAESYAEMGEYSTALLWHQRALQHAVINFKSDDICENPSLTDMPVSEGFLDILSSKAQTLSLIPENHENFHPVCALQTFLLAGQLTDSIRLGYGAELSKYELAKSTARVFHGGIKMARLLFEKENSPEFLEIAFGLSEKHKAMVLLEALNVNQAKKFGKIPPDILKLEKEFRKQIVFWRDNIFTEQQRGSQADSLTLVEYENALFKARQSHDSLMQVLDQNYPEFYQLKYQISTAGISDIQARLPFGTDMLEFYVGENTIHSFRISNHSAEWKVVSIEGTLNKIVTLFRESIYRNFTELNADEAVRAEREKNYLRYGVRLYDLLFKPWDKVLAERLIIIPDGVLGYIPFDALLTTTPQKPGAYRAYPYLIDFFTLSQHYSATLWHRYSQGEKAITGKKTGIYAPVFTQSEMKSELRNTPSPLPFSETEARKIARIIGGKPYLFDEATKEAFFRESSDYQIIHLSSHARVNDLDPLFSTIDFADGSLNIQELLALDLNAELVTLSACETGDGTLFRGEGIMSLARGFMYAGARSIVNTLWEVNDAATAKVMTGFYRHLQQEKPKDIALTNAKLDYLKEADNLTSHPFYWAGYIAVGNMEPVQAGRTWWKWILLAVGIVLIPVFLGWRKKS